MIASPRRLCATLAFAVFPPFAALAEDKPELKIELNALSDAGQSCRATFLLTNRMPAEISKAALEFAFFNKAGSVERLSVFNFGRLQMGRTVVRQFDLPGGPCGSYSRVLLNAVKNCDGIAGDADACEAALTTSNRSGTDFGL